MKNINMSEFNIWVADIVVIEILSLNFFYKTA